MYPLAWWVALAIPGLLGPLGLFGSPHAIAQAEPRPKIYYLIPTLIDEFQTESQRMIEGVFSALNYRVISIDAQGNPELQIRQLKKAADDHPVAIILNAVDSVSIAKALQDVKPKGVPVLVYDRMLSTEEAFDFASVSDAEEIGKMAARRTIELLGIQPGSSVPKTILQIVGDPGDSYSLRVLGGFRTTTNAYKNIRVITVPAMGWEPGNARKAAEDALRSNPRVDLIFCHSADLAAAVIPLFESKIRANQVMVMAITGAPVGLDNLSSGLQKFEIEQPLYAQVYGLALGLRAVIDVTAGRPGLKDGKCEFMGVPGSIEHGGRVLKLQGRPLNTDDLKGRANLGLWGDLARPIKSNEEISKLTCESR